MYGTTISAVQAVTLLVGVFLPILVAAVTKLNAPPAVRSITLLVLSAVASVLNAWLVAPGGFDWGQAVWGTVTSFVVSVATLYGLWKPTGVSDAAKRSLVK